MLSGIVFSFWQPFRGGADVPIGAELHETMVSCNQYRENIVFFYK
jgi:hypothetical protein